MAVIKKVTPKGANKIKTENDVVSKAKKADDQIVAEKVDAAQEVVEGKDIGLKSAGRSKKVCFFCQSKTEPRYSDAASLRRYLSDRGRINPRGRSGACSKHQRRVSREIKRARHLALLPFTLMVH